VPRDLTIKKVALFAVFPFCMIIVAIIEYFHCKEH
jgi:hypothetical protein